MTPAQIATVQRTFAEVLRRRADAGAIFYDRLFLIAADVRPLFKGDMASQQRKLVDTLSVAVGALNDMPGLTAVLSDLGRRHVRYGVRRAHYAPVGEALLWTLEKALGPLFTAEAREAWASLYATVAEVIVAAEPATP